MSLANTEQQQNQERSLSKLEGGNLPLVNCAFLSTHAPRHANLPTCSGTYVHTKQTDIENKQMKLHLLAPTYNSALTRQIWEDNHEFKTNLIYKASSRPFRAT